METQARPPILGFCKKTLDKLDRVVIPENIRLAFGDEKSLYLVPWLDRSIGVFSLECFQDLTRRFCGKPSQRFQADRRNLLRHVGTYACQANLDQQGRIIIPKPLKDWAYIEKEVTLLGAFDMCEIWATSKYREVMEKSKVEYDKALETVLCEDTDLPGDSVNASRTGDPVKEPES
jgi:MraZ protein